VQHARRTLGGHTHASHDIHARHAIHQVAERRSQQRHTVVGDDRGGEERGPVVSGFQPRPPMRAMLIPTNAAADVIASLM
jgi:hypothetical protein